MVKMTELPAALATYPRSGTFGELLNWHLRWGTRAFKCSTTNKSENVPWTDSAFAQLVHGVDFPIASATKNLRNWRSGRLPDEKKDADRIDRVFTELFDSDQRLRRWKADLQHALQKGRTEQSARIARRPLEESSAIPRTTPHFMGRGGERDKLVKVLLSDNGSSAILVQGGPGMGKTELTKAVAHQKSVAKRFGERRWFVSLETSAAAKPMQDAIARAIGYDPARSFQELLNSLRGKPTLLVLDNLETPWEGFEDREATESVLAELCAVEGVSVIASIRGSQSPRGSLWYKSRLDGLPANIAAELFSAIAGAWVKSDSHFGKFITALGGIPLAIELVAHRAEGRASLTPLWQKWEEIGTRFGEFGHPKSRLTSLECSIELSLNSPRVKSVPGTLRLFQLLGCCPAGLTAGDSEALLACDAFNASESLCHSGLAIERLDRVDLLPPIRDHAKRYHRPVHNDAKGLARHFIDLVEGLNRDYPRSPDAGLVRRVELEFYNIEAAFRDVIKRDELADVRGIHALGFPVTMRGIPTTIFDDLRVTFYAKRDAASVAHCDSIIGQIALGHSDLVAAQQRFELARDGYKLNGDVRGEAQCTTRLAEIETLRSNYIALTGSNSPSALSLCELALNQYNMLGDVWGQASCLRKLGVILTATKSYMDARRAYDESFSRYQELGDRLGEANCLKGMGDVALLQGDHANARSSYMESFVKLEEVGDIMGSANCLSRLGDVASRCLDFGSAETFYEDARKRYEHVGHNLGIAGSLLRTGDAYFNQHRYNKAQSAYEHSLLYFQRIGMPEYEAECLENIGDSAVGLSEYGGLSLRLKTLFEKTKRWATLKAVAVALSRLGELAMMLGKLEVARDALRQADKGYEQIGDIRLSADCNVRMGEIALSAFTPVEAKSDFLNALRKYEILGYEDGKTYCLTMIRQIGE